MKDYLKIDYELEELLYKYEAQKKTNDDLQYITLSNVRFLEGRKSYNEGNYHLAINKIQESIDALINNFRVVINFRSAEKSSIIIKTKRFMIDRAKYLVSAYIIDQNLGREIKQINQLKSIILKTALLKNEGFNLGKMDTMLAIEEGIIFTIIKHPEKLPELALDDSLFEPSKISALSKERRLALQKANYINKLRKLEKNAFASSVEVSKERAKNHHIITKIIAEEDTEEDKINYHEHFVDYRKYSCLSTNQPDVFWKRYDLLQLALEEFIAFEHESDYSVRNAHFETAFVLIHGMRIARTAIEKEEIARLITMHYLYVGSYNTERFRVYWDWYKLANKILKIRVLTQKSLAKLCHSVESLKSVYYIDRDEDFINKSLPEIKETQNNIFALRDYLIVLYKKDDKTIVRPKTLRAALTLYTEQWMDASSAFEILKKFVEIQLKVNISPEPLHLFGNMDEVPKSKNLDLISNGETDEIEFKETWKYDVRQKIANRAIEDSALKNIAAFMNTNGGTLFVGVNDSGNITDLNLTEARLYKKDKNIRDELRKLIDDRVSQSLGTQRSTLLKIEFDSDNGRLYAVITVRRSLTPVFMNEEFYIRRSASSVKLSPSEILHYYQERFMS